MRLAEGKDMVLRLILAGQRDAAWSLLVSLWSAWSHRTAIREVPHRREGARAIHRFSGWHVPTSLGWFSGGYDQPVINGTAFYWYAFAIPEREMYRAGHYFICDYLQMREWVLSFAAPRGNDHRDHASWRADLRLYPGEQAGYFRWGDEPAGVNEQPGRVFQVDNVATIAMPPPAGQHVGGYGAGGESAAHKLLKLYVAGHPLEFGLSPAAIARIEYPFATGDRVDVMFENHMPDRTVIEVEVEGEREVCVGIHQAIKYRSLAAADAGYPLLTSRVRSLVVAYSNEYSKARELADRYDIPLVSVNREKVLNGAR